MIQQLKKDFDILSLKVDMMTAIGKENLEEKGVVLDDDASLLRVIQNIKNISQSGGVIEIEVLIAKGIYSFVPREDVEIEGSYYEWDCEAETLSLDDVLSFSFNGQSYENLSWQVEEGIYYIGNLAVLLPNYPNTGEDFFLYNYDEKQLRLVTSLPADDYEVSLKKQSGAGAKPEQEKTVDITTNGTTEVLPDEGSVLSKVTVNVDVSSNESDTLPDWDDDSPIIASGYGGTTRVIWEITEKGTMRWKSNPSGTGTGAYTVTAGWDNTVIVASQSKEYMELASKVKQIDVGQGLTNFYQGYAINCERIRIYEDCSNVTLVCFVSLKEIICSDNTLAKVKYSNGMYSIEKITVPHSLTTLPNSFANMCINLREVNIENVTAFSQNCFNECINLNKDIVFNAGLVTVEDKAFCRTGIKSVKFTNSLDSLPTIGTNVFMQCKSLAEIYCPWEQGAVANAPWGATNATIHYNYVEGENTNAES